MGEEYNSKLMEYIVRRMSTEEGQEESSVIETEQDYYVTMGEVGDVIATFVKDLIYLQEMSQASTEVRLLDIISTLPVDKQKKIKEVLEESDDDLMEYIEFTNEGENNQYD